MYLANLPLAGIIEILSFQFVDFHFNCLGGIIRATALYLEKRSKFFRHSCQGGGGRRDHQHEPFPGCRNAARTRRGGVLWRNVSILVNHDMNCYTLITEKGQS